MQDIICIIAVELITNQCRFDMIRIAIVGATGFTGVELVKLLKKHPKIDEIDLFSFNNSGKPIKYFSDELNNYDDILLDYKKINFNNYDLIFFACPNGTVMDAYKEIRKSNTKVIDLAADFRLDDQKDWDQYYGLTHKAPDDLASTVYGLTEINRDRIKAAKIVANPGCYPTAAIIALYPLLKNELIFENRIIIDAKSGYSGAGRKNLDSGLGKNIKNNFIPYNFYKHRHHPEITQELNKASIQNVDITFSPHVLPIYRGILETIYVDLKEDVDYERLLKIYKDFYYKEYFIKIKGKEYSEIKDVINTNNAQISFHLGKNKKLTIVSVIDNLLKGAAGQAVQNMNLMLGFDELIGLKNE